jgi:guanosine-3',5'-bis(diphosphate) 3'-pyrophosphohydrolase
MIRINDIVDRVMEYNPGADVDVIERAYVYSARVHLGQMRLSGEPYLSHPLEVAAILSEMKLDAESIAAGLLHDVVEDTKATPEEIEDIFGSEIKHIVSGVTKLSKLPFGSKQARQAESIRKMLLAMADDIRVILIKLADRLHNMKTLQFHKENKRRAIAKETIDIYAPISARLGIYWIKNELEDMSFRYLQPDEHKTIEDLINKDITEREKYIEEVKSYIKKKMDDSGLACEVLGRHKHIFSIHQKMVQQDLSFEDVYDIIAFRVILDTIPKCYEALGMVHSLWKPIAKKFKDYIGVPKANMYQSLHTTVIGPYGERIEIQIRTREMDQVAKSGIAAHWGYKEGKRVDNQASEKFAWIQNLVENQAEFLDPQEFLENVRIDLFPDEVYVFTPQGEIKSLPRGATPIDFAYMIHSEVVNQCTGAKVNGRMVPLKYEMQTGNIIEIITSKGSHPSKDWLNFVKTVKARSKIRQWIKIQEKERSLTLGREMCEKTFRKYKLNFNALLKTEDMREVVAHFGFKNVEDLIASVGYGKTTPVQIARRLALKTKTLDTDDSLLNKLISRVRKRKPNSGIVVKGIDDILVRFGKCCQPVPGDNITGYITHGHGVAIHRTNCVNALKMSPERRIDVEWSLETRESYPVKIRISSLDRVGLLADMAATISKNDANILSLNTETKDDQSVISVLTLGIESTAHLEKVLSDLKKIKYVQSVRRLG